eukprot:TRINITY_DN12188_c0_g1_i1.p1 TRINITY_DN12188_c0_g1~~TRINITY_DN12188_c0_g1_i1.p1  ORF type:complete len:1222 (+),score=232.69 TRINITY_DN12188_c0_g1_i1:67-3732(+)
MRRLHVGPALLILANLACCVFGSGCLGNCVNQTWNCSRRCIGSTNSFAFDFSYGHALGSCLETIPLNRSAVQLDIDLHCALPGTSRRVLRGDGSGFWSYEPMIGCDNMHLYAVDGLSLLDTCSSLGSSPELVRESCSWVCKHRTPAVRCKLNFDPTGALGIQNRLEECWLEETCTVDWQGRRNVVSVDAACRPKDLQEAAEVADVVSVSVSGSLVMDTPHSATCLARALHVEMAIKSALSSLLGLGIESISVGALVAVVNGSNGSSLTSDNSSVLGRVVANYSVVSTGSTHVALQGALNITSSLRSMMSSGLSSMLNHEFVRVGVPVTVHLATTTVLSVAVDSSTLIGQAVNALLAFDRLHSQHLREAREELDATAQELEGQNASNFTAAEFQRLQALHADAQNRLAEAEAATAGLRQNLSSVVAQQNASRQALHEAWAAELAAIQMLAAAEANVNSTQAEISRLNAAHAEALQRLRHMVSNYSQAKSLIAATEVSQQAAEEAVADVTAELSAVREDLWAARAAHNDTMMNLSSAKMSLASEIAEHQHTLLMLEETQVLLDGTRSALNLTIAALQETKRTLNDTVASLRNQGIAHDNTKADLNKTLAALGSTNATLKATLASLNNTQAALDAKDAALVKTLASLDDTKAALETKAAALEAALALLNDTEATLEANRVALDSHAGDLNATRSILRDKEALLDKTKATLNETISALHNSGALHALLNKTLSSLNDTEAALRESEMALQSHASALNETRSQLQEAEGRVNETRAALNDTLVALELQGTTLNKTKAMLNETQAALQTHVSDLNETRSKLEDREGSLNETKAALNDTRAALAFQGAVLNKTKAMLNQTLAALSSKDAALNATLVQMGAALDEKAATLEKTLASLNDTQASLARARQELAERLQDQATWSEQLRGTSSDVISGSMELTVADCSSFISLPGAIDSIQQGLAEASQVDAERVQARMECLRRLASVFPRQLDIAGASEHVLVGYEVLVPTGYSANGTAGVISALSGESREQISSHIQQAMQKNGIDSMSIAVTSMSSPVANPVNTSGIAVKVIAVGTQLTASFGLDGSVQAPAAKLPEHREDGRAEDTNQLAWTLVTLLLGVVMFLLACVAFLLCRRRRSNSKVELLSASGSLIVVGKPCTGNETFQSVLPSSKSDFKELPSIASNVPSHTKRNNEAEGTPFMESRASVCSAACRNGSRRDVANLHIEEL